MAENKKICPFLSDTVEDCYCIQHQCAMWIEVYTTELIKVQDCSFALIPQMVDGQLRV